MINEKTPVRFIILQAFLFLLLKIIFTQKNNHKFILQKDISPSEIK